MANKVNLLFRCWWACKRGGRNSVVSVFFRKPLFDISGGCSGRGFVCWSVFCAVCAWWLLLLIGFAGESAGCSECCLVAPLAAVFISPDEVMLFVVGFRKLLLLPWFLALSLIAQNVVLRFLQYEARELRLWLPFEIIIIAVLNSAVWLWHGLLKGHPVIVCVCSYLLNCGIQFIPTSFCLCGFRGMGTRIQQ